MRCYFLRYVVLSNRGGYKPIGQRSCRPTRRNRGQKEGTLGLFAKPATTGLYQDYVR